MSTDTTIAEPAEEVKPEEARPEHTRIHLSYGGLSSIVPDDGVNRLERRKKIAPLALRANGPLWSLQATNRIIAVDRDHEEVALAASANQHIDVSGVQQIEHAIREYDPSCHRPAPSLRRRPIHDLLQWIGRPAHNGPSACG